MPRQRNMQRAIAPAPSFIASAQPVLSEQPFPLAAITEQQKYSGLLSRPSRKATYACNRCREYCLTCDSDVHLPCTNCFGKTLSEPCQSLPKGSVELKFKDEPPIHQQLIVPDHQYVGDRHQYVGDNHSYVGNNHQYGGDTHQYMGNNHQYGGNNHQYRGNNYQYGGNNYQCGGNNYQCGGNNYQYMGDNHPYVGNNHQYGGDTHQYMGNNHQYGGDTHQYMGEHGLPLGQTKQEPWEEDQRKETLWENEAELVSWGSVELNGQAVGTAEEPMSITEMEFDTFEASAAGDSAVVGCLGDPGPDGAWWFGGGEQRRLWEQRRS